MDDNISKKNSEKMKLYLKKYRETHSELMKKKTKCEVCNGSYSYANHSAHCRTMKHKYALLVSQLKYKR